MSINLLETVQQNLGYPPLQKIDPNTQETTNEKTHIENKFSQAAIPAVLNALYRYVQYDEGAEELLHNTNSVWLDKIFENNKEAVIKKIFDYAGTEHNKTINDIAAIADEAVRLTKESLPETSDIREVKLFLKNQKTNFLLYLPVSLHMGELLKDNTLDDNTNKMEGPVSSLMQNIGSAFSKPVTGEEIKPD
ncbi:MAG: hypothetical protein WBP16_02135 [Ferruginibacter sp.]